MGGITEVRELHHEQRDLKRQLEQLTGMVKWLLLIAGGGLALSLLTFILMLARTV